MLSHGLGLLISSPWLLPFLNTAVAYPLMVRALARGRVAHAIRLMWCWALALAIGGTALSLLAPAQASALVLNGEAYWQEMRAWLETGQGREADPVQFLPQHLLHAGTFVLLTLCTGGLLGMPLGAALMNYMGYYVAHVGSILAWHPWVLIRVASFVILGVIFSGPLLSRVLRFPYRLADQKRWLSFAVTGLLLDVILKWVLADWWRLLLACIERLGDWGIV